MVRLAVALSLLLCPLTVPASATIIGGSVTGGTALTAGGIFVKLTAPLANPFGPPDSVGNDNFQSSDLFGFDEAQDITLGAPLTVDVGGSNNARAGAWQHRSARLRADRACRETDQAATSGIQPPRRRMKRSANRTRFGIVVGRRNRAS